MRYLFASLVSGTDIDLAPVGLAYVAAALRQTGRYVSGINLAYHKDSYEALLQKIEYDDIDVLCLGELSRNFLTVRRTIAEVRKSCPHVKIIVGGGIITAEPEFIVQHLDMDFGCIGYGEETICEFAERLETDGDFSKVKGLIYKDETGQMIINPQRPEPGDLDGICFPALELFGFTGNSQRLPIVGARSCTHNCTFCFHPSGYRYRERSLDSIFAEIDYWRKKYEIKSITFMDELFGKDEERLYAFCSRIKKLGISFSISLRVDIVTEELIQALADAGCAVIAYGIESVNQKVLDSMRKQITVEQIEYALKTTHKIAHEYNFLVSGSLIFGDRIETYEMATEALNWWFENIHYGLSLDYIKAYPGTALYKHSVATGRIKNKLIFLENRCSDVNHSAMSDVEFAKLRRQIKYLNDMVTMPAVNMRFEMKEGVVMLCGDCPCCGTANYIKYEEVDVLTYSLFKQRCTACDSTIRLIIKHKERLFENRYFEEFDYDGKRIAVWGLSEIAKYRIASNRKMREAVAVIVDRDYRRFEDGFLGITVQSPKVLSTVEFDVLYIGSRVAREDILNMSIEIVGSKMHSKEIMFIA